LSLSYINAHFKIKEGRSSIKPIKIPIKFEQYIDRLYWRNMRNTQHTKQKNTQKHFAGDGDRDDFAGDGGTWGTHTVIGSTPLQIDTVDPIPHHARPKKAEPGRHACQRAKGSST